MTLDPSWVQAIASVATLGAASIAAWVAWKAPKAAALFAEDYRRQSAFADEQEKLKRTVFIALMKGRRQLLHHDTIAALNVIDATYIDAPQVRQAWRDFVAAAEQQPFEPVRVVERYHAILTEISRHLGFSEQLTPDDLRLGYYPMALGKIDEAALAQAEETIARNAASRLRH